MTETRNTGKPETHRQTLYDNEPCTANTQMQTLTQEEKNNIDTIRRIMSEKKNFAISQEPRLEDSQSETEKIQTTSLSLTTLYTQEQN